MLKRVLAVVLGFVIGFIVVGLIQMLSSKLYPPDPDMLVQDVEAMERYFKSLPHTARLIIVIAHFVGAFVGTFIAAKLADQSKMIMAILVGIILFIASISYNIVSLMPGAWFLLDLITTGLAAYLGARLGSRI